MELITYLRIFRRWWWLVALPIVVTIAASVTLTSRRPPLYEAESTFLVVPRVGPDQAVSAVNTLIGGVEINATFAAIAESDRVEEEVSERLGDEVSLSKISIAAGPVTGTNLVSVRVKGRDPDQVFVVASAFGAEILEYADGLDQPFGLEALDSPKVPDEPVGDDLVVTVAIAGILGAFLGAVLALVAESISRIRTEARERSEASEAEERTLESFSTIDAESGVHNERFFRLRLREEMSRTEHAGGPLSVGVAKYTVSDDDDNDAAAAEPPPPPAVAVALARTLRKEDVLARLDDGDYVILLPGMNGSAAREASDAWEQAIATVAGKTGATGAGVDVVTGVCRYAHGSFEGSRVAERVARRLAAEGGHPDADAPRAPGVPAPRHRRWGFIAEPRA